MITLGGCQHGWEICDTAWFLITTLSTLTPPSSPQTCCYHLHRLHLPVCLTPSAEERHGWKQRGGFAGPHCLVHGRWVRARQPFIISSKVCFLLGRGHCSSQGTSESLAFQEKHQGNLGSPCLADITHLDLIQFQVPQKQKDIGPQRVSLLSPQNTSRK